MSDKDFVDVGDELVIKISGYPVGKAVVKRVNSEEGVVAVVFGKLIVHLPLNVKDYDVVDGYGHFTQPLQASSHESLQVSFSI